MMLPPRLLTACSALPPEGAAAPVARQSRFRGPGLHEEKVRLTNAPAFDLWH